MRRVNPPAELPPAASGPAPAGVRPRAGRRTALWAGGAVAVVLLAFAPACDPSLEFTHRDAGRIHVPAKRWIAAELAAGRFPEWMPQMGLGAPVLGNANLGTLHPLALLLLALPPSTALVTWIVLSVALAAAGAFAWARTLGRGDAAAAVAALAFGLSGPIVSSTDNLGYLGTYAALPWILAAARRFGEVPAPGRLALVGLASYLGAAGGDPQGWAVALALLPAQGAALAARGERLRGALRGAIAAGAGAIAAAPVVLPVVLWARASTRAAGLAAAELQRWNVAPVRLPEVLLPGMFAGDGTDAVSAAFWYAGNRFTIIPWFASLYLGATVLALAALAVARDRAARPLAVAALAFAWASLGHHAGFSQLVAGIPWVGAFRYQEKLFVWPALAAAALAAAGVDALLADPRPPRTRGLLALAGALLAAAAAAALAPAGLVPDAPGPAAVLARNVARGGAQAAAAVLLLAAAFRWRARGAPVPRTAVALCLAVAADLLAGSARAWFLGAREPATPPPLASALRGRSSGVVPLGGDRESRWPSRPRTESRHEWMRRTLAPMWSLPLGIRTSRDYVPLVEERWARLGAAVAGREAALGLLGFDHLVVDAPGRAAEAGVPGPWQMAADLELPAYAVAMPARPRAYVARIARAATADEALRFAEAGGAPEVTVLEGPAPDGPAEGSASIARDESDRVEVRVAVFSGGPALLVLNDLFAPGWTAAVDGRPAPILRANAVARGVLVPPGRHVVSFAYRTPGLAAGAAAALLGAGALAAWAAVRRRRADRARTRAAW